MTVTSPSSISSALTRLGLAEENPGAFAGEWFEPSGKVVHSLNPATGEPIAAVHEVLERRLRARRRR